MKDLFKTLGKYRRIFNSVQKRKIIYLLFMMIIASVLETFGVSMIVPLITVMMDEEFFSDNRFVVFASRLFHLEDTHAFMIFIMCFMIGIYLVKGIFLILKEYVQTRFITNNRVDTQRRIMAVYLDYPYEFYLDKSTADVMKIIVNDVSNCFGLLTSIMTFFSEILISLSLFIAICFVDIYMAAFVTIVVLIQLILIFKFMKKRMFRCGVIFRQANTEGSKWVMQAVSGIKETKVAKKEAFFTRQYTKYARQAAVAGQGYNVLSAAPRVILESVTVSAMLLLMLILLMNGKSLSQLLPQFSAFALAAVRILPSANKISNVMADISYYSPAMDAVVETLTIVNNHEKSKVIQNNTVSERDMFSAICEVNLQNISYKYPNTEKYILDNANMKIPIGKSVGIIGESGAGKTTAVDIILGLLVPQKGQIVCDGVDIMEDYGRWLSKISYIPQMIFMLDDTIAANIAYGIGEDKIDEEKIWQALDEASLKEYVSSLPDTIYTEIGERGVRLSGGQRQRIGIARALYTDPEIIVLDEATSALDNETEIEIMDSINALHGKKTLIIIAHRLTTISDCDIVYRVADGKIKEVENRNLPHYSDG